VSVSLGIVRKGSLFTAEYPVQKIFDEIADFGVRCPQVGVVAQTHAVAHFAARCALVHQLLEALVQCVRRFLASWQVLHLPVVRRRIDGDRYRFRNIHVLLHVRRGRSSSPIPDLPTRSHNPSRMRELEPA